MFELLAKGGVLVIPILFCSVVALSIFLERVIRFARMRKRGDGLELEVAEKLKNKQDQDAYEIAGSSDSPMGRVLVQAIEVKDQDRETLETVIVHATDG